MQPSRPTPLAKLGRYFRSAFVPAAPAILARRAFTCPMCQALTAAGSRQWSPNFKSYVDTECIPAIVRAHGQAAVTEWLESGSFYLESQKNG